MSITLKEVIDLGYRSDVAVVIKAKDGDKLLKAAKDWDKKYNLICPNIFIH